MPTLIEIIQVVAVLLVVANVLGLVWFWGRRSAPIKAAISLKDGASVMIPMAKNVTDAKEAQRQQLEQNIVDEHAAQAAVPTGYPSEPTAKDIEFFDKRDQILKDLPFGETTAPIEKLFEEIYGRPVVDTRFCGDCSYWDLDEGQSVMNQHPDFLLAAAHLPPAIIGAVIEYEPCPDCPAGIDPPDLPPGPDTEAFKGCNTCRGSGLKRKGPKPTGMPMKASWKDFGACLCEKTFDENGDGGIVWKDDTCEYWKGKTHLKVVASS